MVFFCVHYTPLNISQYFDDTPPLEEKLLNRSKQTEQGQKVLCVSQWRINFVLIYRKINKDYIYGVCYIAALQRR